MSEKFLVLKRLNEECGFTESEHGGVDWKIRAFGKI